MTTVLTVVGYCTDHHGITHAYAHDGHALCSQYVDLASLTGEYVTCVNCMQSVIR